MVRCACLPARSRTPLSLASATASASVSSLAWLPASPPVSLCRLSSVEHLVGWIITPCLGKDCFPPPAGSLSEPDCTGLWASDSPSHLPFSSLPAKSSPTLAACVLRSTIQRLAVHGLRVASFGEQCSVPSATRWQP